MLVKYGSKIQCVYAAILAEPAADHASDAMAEIAALSRFHFHRASQSLCDI